MNLHVWWDPPADGPANMAADESLAEEAVARDACCVRVYGWKHATVSLGGFQRAADAAAVPAIAGVPLVRRPSGGGAIVHGSDLTYAAAVPRTHAWGGRPQAFYDAFHDALCAALGEAGIAAAPWRAPAAAEEDVFLCFDRRAAGDVVIDPPGGQAPRGHKVLGSAQRRLAAAVLQHGSLLVRRSPAVGEPAAHPGLLDLAPGRLAAGDVPTLATRWLGLVAERAGLRIVPETAAFWNEASVRERAEQFASDRWTLRR